MIRATGQGVNRLIEYPPRLLEAFPEGLVHPLALADVGHDCHEADDDAELITQGSSGIELHG